MGLSRDHVFRWNQELGHRFKISPTGTGYKVLHIFDRTLDINDEFSHWQAWRLAPMATCMAPRVLAANRMPALSSR